MRNVAPNIVKSFHFAAQYMCHRVPGCWKALDFNILKDKPSHCRRTPLYHLKPFCIVSSSPFLGMQRRWCRSGSIPQECQQQHKNRASLCVANENILPIFAFHMRSLHSSGEGAVECGENVRCRKPVRSFPHRVRHFSPLPWANRRLPSSGAHNLSLFLALTYGPDYGTNGYRPHRQRVACESTIVYTAGIGSATWHPAVCEFILPLGPRLPERLNVRTVQQQQQHFRPSYANNSLRPKLSKMLWI